MIFPKFLIEEPKKQIDTGDRTRHVRFELSPKTLVALVLVVASLWLLIRLWPILLVLAVALLVAGTLSPAVSWLEEKRVRRGFGIAIVFTVFFILALLVVFLTIPMLVSQAVALLENEPALRTRLAGYLAGSPLRAPLAPRSHHIRLSRIMMNLETIVVAYIRGQMVTCLLMALFVFGLLKACGVENALAIAAVAGLADVLPHIGPILSVGPGARGGR